MNTRVFRIDLDAEPAIDTAIAAACDRQLTDGFKLASSFIWASADNETHNLVLIFQKTV